MEEVLEFKCASCGNRLFSKNAVDGLVECDCCGELRAVPRKDNSPAALSFLRMGEHDLDNGKFADAYSAYAKAAELSPKEPEAYFGMALAGLQVRYIKDEVNGRLQPICYEYSAKKFIDDENYHKALKTATLSQGKEYRRRAEEIDYIKQEFYRMKRSGLDYDCFLCVKVTDEKGEKTEDYKDAGYIYDLLQRNGYKPFFSERDIRNKQGADYEAMILYALHTSETMLVICRNASYLQTKWVKNEYTRFIKLTSDGEKDCDSITTVYYRTPIEKLEGKNGKVQGIDFSLREADEQILNFVESHTEAAKKRKEEEERQKAAREEEIRKQIEEAKKAQTQLEERLKNLQTVGAGAPKSADASVTSLFERAKIELANADFSTAKSYFNRVLDVDPKFAEAWWGLFLCDFKTENENSLLVIDKLTKEFVASIKDNKNFKRAKEFALGEFREKINEFEKKIDDLLSPKSLLKYADELLLAGKSASAANYYEWVLETELECAEAWWGLFLKDYNCKSYKQLLQKIQAAEIGKPSTYNILFDIYDNANFINAEKYAAGEFLSKINDLKTHIHDKIFSLSNATGIITKDFQGKKVRWFMPENYLQQDSPVRQFYEKVANYDAQNADANFALFLLKRKWQSKYNVVQYINRAKADEEGVQSILNIQNDKYYINAKKYSEGNLKETINDIETELENKKQRIKKELENVTENFSDNDKKLEETVRSLSAYKEKPYVPITLVDLYTLWVICFWGGIILGVLLFALTCWSGNWMVENAASFGFLRPIVKWLGGMMSELAEYWTHNPVLAILGTILSLLGYALIGFILLIPVGLLYVLFANIPYLIDKKKYKKKVLMYEKYSEAYEAYRKVEKGKQKLSELKQITENW